MVCIIPPLKNQKNVGPWHSDFSKNMKRLMTKVSIRVYIYIDQFMTFTEELMSKCPLPKVEGYNKIGVGGGGVCVVLGLRAPYFTISPPFI